MKTKLRNQKGFTIIEVLIVLAIAGLILLIVFLAVPALQRNSRNTQRKNDVQAILGGVTEFENNNAGQLPNNWAAGPPTQIIGAAGSTSAGVKVGYYTTVTFAAGPQAAVGTDIVNIVTGAKCAGAGATVAGSARQVAAQYEIEGGNGTLVPTCQDS